MKKRQPGARTASAVLVTRALLVLVVVLGALSTGCAATIVYAAVASSAASSLEEAKTLNADRYAQFEYYYAKENLEKAAEEASDASYGDAIKYAGIAEEYADKAVDLARAGHRGAGR